MSYWGWRILAKGGPLLAVDAAVVGYGGEVLTQYVMGEGRELWTADQGANGSGDLAAIVRSTGAPAMAFYVLGEDCVVGEAAALSGPVWNLVFREDMLLSDYAQALPLGYQREDAVADALDWAVQAGLDADPVKVEQAFADGWMEDLYDAFGLPEAERAGSS